MGFNNCYIPNYNQLIEYYNSVDLETFIKRFKKYDSWSGDSDAMNFLETKIKLWHTTNIDGGQRVKHIDH